MNPTKPAMASGTRASRVIRVLGRRGEMREAGDVLCSLRQDVVAQAVFVVDDRRRILVFDTDPGLPPGKLDDLTATQIARAESMLRHVDEATAGIAWELPSGESLYVTRLSEGLVLAIVLPSAEITPARVYAKVRALRVALVSALTETTGPA
jgi:hypothetical protein